MDANKKIKNRADEFSESDRVNLDGVFSGTLPASLASLVYSLEQLDDDGPAPLQQAIRIIYKAFIQDVDSGLRYQVFCYVVQEVISGKLNPEAILAVMQSETSHLIVNKAVGAYLLYKRASFKEPFAATSTILRLLREKRMANDGAVFAGLVCFGDRRVCAIARTIRRDISLEEARAFSIAARGPLQRSTIDFCIEWLIQLMKQREHELAIQVAYALSSMVINDSTLLVHEVEYNFGPYGFSIARRAPAAPFEEVLGKLEPLVAILSQGKLPTLQRMIDILRDPARNTLDRLERRKASTRRVISSRRVSDRRIVNIQPHVERRQGQRRDRDRRMALRR